MFLVGLLFLLGGFLGLVAVIGAPWRVWRLRRRGVRTTGTVLEHIVEPDHVASMQVNFVDQHGQSQSATVSPSDTHRGFVAVRERLDVVYLPTKPREARPVEVTEKFLGPPNPVPRVRLLVMLLFDPGECRLRRQLRQHGIRTQATVIWHSYKEKGSTPRNPGWCPLIGFVDQDGRTRTFISPAHGRQRVPPIGREIPVIYLPNHSRVRSQATSAEAPSFTTLGRSQAHLSWQATPADIPSFPTLVSQFLVVCVLLAVGLGITMGDRG